MSDVEVVVAASGSIPPEVHLLIDAAKQATGRSPLSDQSWLDLEQGGRPGAASVLAWSGTLDADGASRRLDGMCHVSPGNDSWTIEVVLDRSIASEPARIATADRLVRAALGHVARKGGGRVHWWVVSPDDVVAEVAVRHGFAEGRTLHQMRVPLPLAVTAPADLALRAFRIGEDEADWLEVNNAAFADHPEQGGWDLATLHLREAEDWFDPQGFLLHHRDGRLAAFCWTKLHTGTPAVGLDASPDLGEIYVIAVHPDFHGLGLGRSLTLAGLDSIAGRGIATGMLYVDRDNAAAFGLYQALGFRIHRTDRAYVVDIAPLAPPGPHSRS